MERQRCKRATSKHGSMISQILLQKKADTISSAKLSKRLRDSTSTITKLWNWMKTFEPSYHSLLQLGHLELRPWQRLQNPSLFPLIPDSRMLRKKSPSSVKNFVGCTSQITCHFNSKGQGHSAKICSPSFAQRHFHTGNSQSCSSSFPIWLFSKPHQWNHFCCTQYSRYYHGWKHQPQICCPNNLRGIFCCSDSTWTWDEIGRKHDL